MTPDSDHRTWDEIITANAILWLRRKAAAQRVMMKPYYLSTLAEEMIPFLYSREEREAKTFNRVAAIERIQKTTNRYLGFSRLRKLPWRLDYLEAFCGAVGVPLHDLMNPETRLSEADQARLDELTAGVPWLQKLAGKNRRTGP